MKKMLTVFLTIALVGGFLVGWMASQRMGISPSHAQGSQTPGLRVLQASTESPPEEFAEQNQVPEPDPERSTVQELEEKLLNLPAGPEAIERAKTNKPGLRVLQASTESPPEEIFEQDQVPKPAQGRSTVQELEQRLLQLSGGPEVIKKARRGERPTGLRWAYPEDLLSWLNPFKVEEARAGETFSLSLSHTISHTKAEAGTYEYNLYSPSSARVIFYGGQERYDTPRTHYSTINSSQITLGEDTSITLEGCVFLGVDLPEDGWYIINIYLSTYGSAELRHYESRASIPVIQSFSGSGSDWDDYPYLGYFEAGNHKFYWTFSRSASVNKVSVDSYP